jgi:endoglucanase Acf2
MADWNDGVHNLEATLGHGSPFVYAEALGGNAEVRFVGNPSVSADEGNVRGVTINGRHYGLFAPTGATWPGTAVVTADLGGRDYFSVAVPPDSSQSTLDLFAKHAFAFVVDTTTSWAYDESAAKVATTLNLTTEATHPASTNYVNDVASNSVL